LEFYKLFLPSWPGTVIQFDLSFPSSTQAKIEQNPTSEWCVVLSYTCTCIPEDDYSLTNFPSDTKGEKLIVN
jgi:hypothetical protein